MFYNIGGKLFRGILNRISLSKTEDTMSPLLIEPQENLPVFDKKYKSIVVYSQSEKYYEITEWLEKNTAGLVSIKLSDELAFFGASNSKMYIAFENSDDALLFKIKFQCR